MPERLAARPAIDPALLRPRGIRLVERTELGKIDLRGDPSDRAFMAAIGRCLDMLLPTEPCSSATQNSVSALWLGPDQWLLTCPASDTPFFIRTLRDVLENGHHALTDVSDARVALRLAGPSARDVLAKGCPLDVHPRAFPVARCAQSLLAKASVLIHLAGDDPQTGPSFDLYVARSFSHYLFSWLEDAGREYGVQVAAAE